MKTLTDAQFHQIWNKLNADNKDVTETDWEWCLTQILAYTGGKRVNTSILDIDTDGGNSQYQLHYAIIEYPTHRITDRQLCDTMDMGNHCISKGSITYEDNLAYITWSNKGHI